LAVRSKRSLYNQWKISPSTDYAWRLTESEKPMMNYGDELPDTPAVPTSSDTQQTPQFLKNNAVALYTLLAILTRIKNTMGLEAMLEYIEHYQKLIERHNPDFKTAVQAALAMMSVEKMYQDISKNEKH